MKHTLFFLLLVVAASVFAEGATLVYDPTNHTEAIVLRNQTIANTQNLLNSMELLRKYLDAIHEQELKLVEEANTIKNISGDIRTEAQTIRQNSVEAVRVLGDPANISIDMRDIPTVTPKQNRTFAELKGAAQNALQNDTVNDEELYGEKAETTLKHRVVEAAYQNYAAVVESASELKDLLILRREALKNALNKTDTMAGQQKLQTALLIVNGQLADIEAQEAGAFRKMEAAKIRNDANMEMEESRDIAGEINNATIRIMEAMSKKDDKK